MKKIALISHGCAKNLVDSELMLGLLAQNGYEITLNEDETDTVIVNTCSFIADAERESIRSILELADKDKRIIVTGCLPQKHPEELKQEIPEIAAPQTLNEILKLWPQNRTLYYMDETGNGINITTAFANANPPAAILVGPEGGFSNDELKNLAQQKFTQGVSLGQRILRAETAVAAALSCWQAMCGDWLNKGE